MARSNPNAGRSETRELVAALQALPVFKDCDGADLQDLASHSNRTSVPKNWSLIHQETPADACYILLSGEAEVIAGGQTIATINAGDVVGEVGLASHKLRNASVMSVTALDLIHIEADQFNALIERRPGLKAALLPRAAPATEG